VSAWLFGARRPLWQLGFMALMINKCMVMMTPGSQHDAELLYLQESLVLAEDAIATHADPAQSLYETLPANDPNSRNSERELERLSLAAPADPRNACALPSV